MLRRPDLGPIRRWRKKLGLQRQWLHARSLAFVHPADGRWVSSPRRILGSSARPGCSPAARMRRSAARTGLLFGLGAYGSWGLFPAFLLLKPAGAFEVLAHRIVWTLVFMVGVLLVAGLGGAAPHRRTHLVAAGGGVRPGVGELGDLHLRRQQRPRRRRRARVFHQPLVSVALRWSSSVKGSTGLGFGPGRRDDRGGGFAVEVGAPPWIAFGLAFSFGLYGLVRRSSRPIRGSSVGVESARRRPFACSLHRGRGGGWARPFSGAGAGRRADGAVRTLTAIPAAVRRGGAAPAAGHVGPAAST